MDIKKLTFAILIVGLMSSIGVVSGEELSVPVVAGEATELNLGVWEDGASEELGGLISDFSSIYTEWVAIGGENIWSDETIIEVETFEVFVIPAGGIPSLFAYTSELFETSEPYDCGSGTPTAYETFTLVNNGDTGYTSTTTNGCNVMILAAPGTYDVYGCV